MSTFQFISFAVPPACGLKRFFYHINSTLWALQCIKDVLFQETIAKPSLVSFTSNCLLLLPKKATVDLCNAGHRLISMHKYREKFVGVVYNTASSSEKNKHKLDNVGRFSGQCSHGTPSTTD